MKPTQFLAALYPFQILIGWVLAMLVCTYSCPKLHAQSGTGANFGIEADAYSGDVISGVLTDDWFFNGVSGAGVVDEATAQANGYAAQLSAGNNIAFDLRQSIPNYSPQGGYIWYSTRYGRDYDNLSTNDLTTFSAGKNGDNPSVAWGSAPGSVPSKTDIIDTGVHMRRNGTNITDDLWVDMMISTLSSSGNHFVDFELFVSEITATGSGFSNSGIQEGHTAWTFDGAGNVTNIGDMVIGFAYSGGGVSGVEIRLWIDRSIFLPGTSPGGTSTFTWGTNIDGGSTYGYAEIVIPAGALFSNVNFLSTNAPPWGTTNTTGYTTSYAGGYLAEVGINFTQLGFDPRTLFGDGAACDSPFSAIMSKSRTSSSFTSALKDFAGPYDFLGSSAEGQVNTTVTHPGNFDSCNSGETFTLQAEFISPTAEYTWYSLSPGVVFPSNGQPTISGVGMDNVLIDTPGDYQLGIAPLLGCTPTTDISDVITVNASPCAFADTYETYEDETLEVVLLNRVLQNDTDLEPDDILTVNTTPVVDVTNGILSLNADGSFTYTPDPGFFGTDSFTYQACDDNPNSLCDTAVATITVTGCGPGSVKTTTNSSGTFYAVETIYCYADGKVSDECDKKALGPADGDETGDFKLPGDEAEFRMGGSSDALSTVKVVFDTFESNMTVRVAISQDGVYYGTIADITTADLDGNGDYNFTAPDAFEYIKLTHLGQSNRKFKLDAIESSYNNTTFNCEPDSDGDLVADKDDLDDDNDGILDTDECTQSVTFSPLSTTGFYSFAQDINGNQGNHFGEQNTGLANDPMLIFDGDVNTEMRLHQDDIFELGFGQDIPAGTQMTLVEGPGGEDELISVYVSYGSTDPAGDTNSASGNGVGYFNTTNGGATLIAANISSGVSYSFILPINANHIQFVCHNSHGGWGELRIDPNPQVVFSPTAEHCDTDGDGLADVVDLDSDRDGCNDVEEAGFTDDDGDGRLGPSPVTVDANGLVTSGSDGYTSPADQDSNGIADFQEAGITPTVTVQPQDVNVIVNSGTSFTMSGNDIDTYQWQLSTDGGVIFSDLSDGSGYSGSSSATLTLLSTSITMNNYMYRAVVSNASLACSSSVTSDAAILNTSVRSVISNRRITIRVNGG